MKCRYLFWLIAVVCSTAYAGDILVIKVDDMINPAVSQFIEQSIEQAEQERAECLIIQLDTPGGLLESTYTILQKLLNSDVPSVVYVHPKGASATSAGVFITLAANIAAMSPATNIGAAHPVDLAGGGLGEQQEPEEEMAPRDGQEPEAEKPDQEPVPLRKLRRSKVSPAMQQKIMNDTVARIRTLARNRGRNQEWAERAVRESVSITEEEAVQLNVIDLIAEDMEDLIKRIDGWKVRTDEGERALETAGKTVRILPMSWRQQFLSLLSNPNIAYLLLAGGMLGLYVELTHPGLIFPGAVGGISLILGFYSLHTLPVNYAGLALILLAFLFFILEVKVQSYGLLTLGGIAALVLGSMMLIDTPFPFLRVSLSVIIPVAAAVGGIAAFLVFIVIRVHRKRPMTGGEGLIDQAAVARTDLDPEGRVFLHGEIWRAIAEQPVRKGELVRVVRREGMTLFVERKKKT